MSACIYQLQVFPSTFKVQNSTPARVLAARLVMTLAIFYMNLLPANDPHLAPSNRTSWLCVAFWALPLVRFVAISLPLVNCCSVGVTLFHTNPCLPHTRVTCTMPVAIRHQHDHQMEAKCTKSVEQLRQSIIHATFEHLRCT